MMLFMGVDYLKMLIFLIQLLSLVVQPLEKLILRISNFLLFYRI